MNKLIHLLLVEDSEDDALLLLRHLQLGGYETICDRVVDRMTMIESLHRTSWDLVIADYMLPNFNGLAALAILKEKNIDIPFIIVSGTIGEDVAVQAMKAGAHDYVMKGNLTRLIPAIQREMDEAVIRRERRRTEIDLHETQDRYRDLFEGSKDAIYFSTAEGKFIDINPAGIELFGYGSKKELLDANHNLNVFFDSKKCQQRNERLLSEGFLKDFESSLTRKDGVSVIVMETTVPVRSAQGTVTMYHSILSDMTVQKQLEQQILQAQKMEGIGTLAGGIAHDFNNILSIILAYSNTLVEKQRTPQEFSDSVSTIVHAVERGASLVQQILTFARKADIQFKQTNLTAAASEMLVMLKETFPKIISLCGDFAKDSPDISADHTQVYQVVLNLCLNARDAMPHGGTLLLKTELLHKEEVREHFPDADQEQYVCLSVMDTGEGMDEQTRLRIFDPFFTTKKDGNGTGLGLSVVYGVMQTHHGFIEVESKLKQGTTFRLYFPVQESSTRPKDLLPQKESIRLEGSETILYVEDEEFIRDIVRLTFESNGYKVYTAPDGITAIQLYSTHLQDIDLVLTDMGLPGMTGMDEYQKLKEINPDVKVIFTSGLIDPDIRDRLIKDGAVGFIQKPFRPGDLLQTIREVLDKKTS
jgi:two-component system, cell cycle sensor histidine kinase and response regulator CckA